MDTAASHQLSALLRYGVSDSLVGLLASVGESTGLNGRKYRESTVLELNRMILCRNYGKPLWWLANLLAAVEATQPSSPGLPASARFFWLDECLSPGAARLAFSGSCSASPEIYCDDQLNILYSDGEFSLSLSKLPLLAALLEFVVALVPDFWERLAALDTTLASAVSVLASYLQSAVNSYLSDHMQPLQQQRKGRMLLQWLDEGQRSIDDQAILDFWHYAAEQNLPDFKLFNTVAECYLALLVALEDGAAGIATEHATSLGSDTDVGEIDPERLEHALITLETDFTPLSTLAKPPFDTIKFLTGQDQRQLSTLEYAKAARCKLPLTIARMAVFGAQQMSITQFARKGRKLELVELVECHSTMSYLEHLEELRMLNEKIVKTRLCVLHILLQLNHGDAAPMLFEDLDGDALDLLRERFGADATGDSSMIENLQAQLNELALRIPALNQRLRAAKAAFKSINRDGFQHLPAAESGDTYAEGAQALSEIARMSREYSTALTHAISQGGGHAVVFASELQRYRAGFRLLYVEYL